jgi:hypothetical protein
VSFGEYPLLKVISTLVALVCCGTIHGESHPTSPGLDSFGGFKDIQASATGWFRIEKIAGRDILVTPEGHPFILLGINHIGAISQHGKNEPDIFAEKYGSDWGELREDIVKQFAEWRFNSTGIAATELRRGLPYTASITLAKTAKYYSPPGGKNPYDFPDVFDESVRDALVNKIRSVCSAGRDDPYLIGYHWTDTPTWDIRKTRIFRHTDWVSQIRKLGATAPGKHRYIEFLRRRYDDDLARLNRAYGLDVKSFDALLVEDFNSVDLQRYDVASDDELFLGVIARQYYGIIGPATRKYDPNHLIFGEKYLMGDHPDQVLEAAMPHIDVLSLQPGDGYIPIYMPGDVFPEEEMEYLHDLIGKPIFICDHQISFATKRYPTATWPYHQRPSEADAAIATEQFIRRAFAKPYIIGYRRCQYIDRYTTRRNGVKLGLLRDDGTIYELLAEHTGRGLHAIRETVYEQLR